MVLDITRETNVIESALDREFGTPPCVVPFTTTSIYRELRKSHPTYPRLVCAAQAVRIIRRNTGVYLPGAHVVAFEPELAVSSEDTFKRRFAARSAQISKYHELTHAYMCQRPGYPVRAHPTELLHHDSATGLLSINESEYIWRSMNEGVADYVADTIVNALESKGYVDGGIARHTAFRHSSISIAGAYMTLQEQVASVQSALAEFNAIGYASMNRDLHPQELFAARCYVKECRNKATTTVYEVGSAYVALMRVNIPHLGELVDKIISDPPASIDVMLHEAKEIAAENYVQC